MELSNNNNNINTNNYRIQLIVNKIHFYSDIKTEIKNNKNKTEYSNSTRKTLKILSNLCGTLITSAKRHMYFIQLSEKCPDVDENEIKEYEKECEKGERKLIKTAVILLQNAAVDVNIPLLLEDSSFKSCVDKIFELDSTTVTEEKLKNQRNVMI